MTLSLGSKVKRHLKSMFTPQRVWLGWVAWMRHLTLGNKMRRLACWGQQEGGSELDIGVLHPRFKSLVLGAKPDYRGTSGQCVWAQTDRERLHPFPFPRWIWLFHEHYQRGTETKQKWRKSKEMGDRGQDTWEMCRGRQRRFLHRWEIYFQQDIGKEK